MLVTRFAPTPSGFLHLGNAVNALLTSWLARAAHGRLLLRIDDFDTARLRPDYLVDVFDTLAWLGIEPDDGPSGPADFEQHWSMALRTQEFRAAAERLHADHPDVVFACTCSRRDLVAGRCVRGCRPSGAPLDPGRSALRLHVPAGDHVLWRRDDLPAYQLGSVLADEALGVTALVRGEDLREATALQQHLAALLPAPGFQRVDARHHSLLTGPDGRKLSKSAGSQARPLPRTDALRQQVHDRARELGAAIGITPP